jgi:hypothetical protein
VIIHGIIASSALGVSPAYESIASASGTGSSATITFSSIPSTYTSLQIRINGRSDALVDTTYIQVQYNATAMTAGHYLRGDGSTVTAGAVNVPMYIAGGNTTANIMGVGIINFQDYSSTSKYNTVGAITGAERNGEASRIYSNSGVWASNSAITSISFTAPSSNFTTSTIFSLYGIKG